LVKGPQNAKYLSNHIQNDLLTSINNVKKRSIEKKINNRLVTIIADETSDCGCTLFDEDLCKSVEQFIGIQRLTSVDANTIFNSLTNKIAQLNINWTLVIAVCFDRASAMSGQFNSVQCKVKEINLSAMYVHCYGHYLNLELVDSLGNKNWVVFVFFGCVLLIDSFIERNPVRHAVFEKIVNETNSRLKTFKTLSTTRWACRAVAVIAVEKNFLLLFSVLKKFLKTLNI